MLGFDPAVVALTFIGLAALLAGAVMLVLRRAERMGAGEESAPAREKAEFDEPLGDRPGLLVIGQGGVVRFANAALLEWLNLPEDAALNLEHIARRCRPEEAFLEVCALPGQERFSLQGMLVDATSVQIPYPDGPATLVTLRRPDIAPLTRVEPNLEGMDALRVLGELSAAMTAYTDLPSTIVAILESVARLIPADIAELTVWSEEEGVLVPYRLAGMPGVDRELSRLNQHIRPGEGYSGRLFTEQRPILVDQTGQQISNPAADPGKTYPFQSYIGIPLSIGGEPIGTLELGTLTGSPYNEKDLETLQLLSSQAAIALQHALTRDEQARRVAELTGLASLTQAVGALRDTRDLFSQLVQSALPLLDVEMLGFLLYDENSHRLQGQVPFAGIPDHFVQLYHVDIQVDQPSAQVWQAQETIVTPLAAEDPRLIDLGLAHLAQAAGIQSTVLVPLTVGGRPLGYLQAANKGSGGRFGADDLRLLSIIAGQSAAILENASLLRDSRRRTLQAEALRRIAALVSSAATLDEILQFSLNEVARLMRVDQGAIFLLDRERYRLSLHVESQFKLPQRALSLASGWLVEDPAYTRTVTATQQPRVMALPSPELETDPVYKPFIEAMAVDSAVSVPLIVSDRSVGEMILGSQTPGFFHLGEVEMAATAAGQIAGAIERVLLTTQSDASLQDRLERLTALTRISRELNAAHEIDELIEMIHAEALALSGANCGSTILFRPPQPAGQTAEIQRIVGDSFGREALTPLERGAIEENGALHVADFKSSPHDPPHADVRTAILVALRQEGHLLGLVSLHAHDQAVFHQEIVETIESFATHAAIALSNAIRLQETAQAAADERRRLQRISGPFSAGAPAESQEEADAALSALAAAMGQTAGYRKVLVSRYDPGTGTLAPAGLFGFEAAGISALSATPLAWSDHAEVLEGAQERSGVFFLAAGAAAIPIRAANGRRLGWIALEEPSHEQKSQGEAPQLLLELAERAQALLEQPWEVDGEDVHAPMAGVNGGDGLDSALAFMLNKDLEQMAAAHHFDLRARRTLAALEIVQAVNQQTSKEGVFQALGDGFVKNMGFELTLLAVPTDSGAVVSTIAGALPEASQAEALLGQRNPLRQSLTAGEAFFVSSLDSNGAGEWRTSPLLSHLQAESFVSLPIHAAGSGNGVEAALLSVSRTPAPAFHPADKEIFHLVCKQTALALQNLASLGKTRERLREVDLLLNFSRRLASLDPSEILDSLIENTLAVVPGAQAAMVALWDADKEALQPLSAAGYPDNAAILALSFAAGEGLPGRVIAEGSALRIDEVDIARDYNLPYEKIVQFQEATQGQIPIASLLVPVASGVENLGVLVLDNFTDAAAFSPEDETLIGSLARQTGLILDNARLLADAKRRARLLESLAESAQTITSDLQVDRITASLLDHLKSVLPFDTGTFWFRQDKVLTVRAAQGFPDDEERLGLTVSVEDSQLLREMVETGRPLYVPNVHEDPRFMALTEFERLSWLGIPLLSKGQVIGVIALEKGEADHYDMEQIQIATTFAGQAAVALENAQLFEDSLEQTRQLNDRTERLDLLYQLSTEFSGSLDVSHILTFTVAALRTAIDCEACTAVIFDDGGQAWITAQHPTPETELPRPFDAAPFAILRESLGVQILDNVEASPAFSSLQEAWDSARTPAATVLSLGSGGELLGLLIVHSRERLTVGEIELATAIGNQISVAMQNARLYEQARKLTEDLERRVEERTSALELEHERSEILLGIITELSASLDMDIVLNRTLALLNRITGAEQSTIILTNPADVTFLRRASHGYATPAPEGGEETPVELNEGLAGWVIRHREPALISDVRKDKRWIPMGKTEHRSAVAIPLMLGEEALGALLLFHRRVSQFAEDQIDLIQAAARQIAVAVNNAHLYLLIRDQAERLGGMLRSQQIEASRLRAILEAVVDGVLVTNDAGEISIFNHAAEEILSLPADRVLGQSLDYFTGLFGGAGKKWMETIRSWSLDWDLIVEGEVFSEQIQLENERVVAVNLAPVFTTNEFLGTVSIFRDITHVIEVDRMKSEFVATVSHELRTPMTSIKGYVDILLMGAAGELSDQQEHFLRVVQGNTERLNVLVNDLLEVSRIEAGRISLDMEPIRLPALAEDVAKGFRGQASEESKPIQITVDTDAAVPSVRGDEDRVRQILQNLIGNAYNYTPGGGEISVTFRVAGSTVETAVKDNGVGISPEDQNRIFERFYRGEAPLVATVAGTGLGLAIVRYLIDLHGGEIRIESSGIPGEGSTFYFTIPIYTEEG